MTTPPALADVRLARRIDAEVSELSASPRTPEDRSAIQEDLAPHTGTHRHHAEILARTCGYSVAGRRDVVEDQHLSRRPGALQQRPERLGLLRGTEDRRSRQDIPTFVDWPGKADRHHGRTGEQTVADCSQVVYERLAQCRRRRRRRGPSASCRPPVVRQQHIRARIVKGTAERGPTDVEDQIWLSVVRAGLPRQRPFGSPVYHASLSTGRCTALPGGGQRPRLLIAR